MTATELLETAIKKANQKGYSDCQILVLLALVRVGKPMGICELAAETKRHRQTVFRSVESFLGGEVVVNRPNRVTSIVHLKQPGVDLLRELVGMEKAS